MAGFLANQAGILYTVLRTRHVVCRVFSIYGAFDDYSALCLLHQKTNTRERPRLCTTCGAHVAHHPRHRAGKLGVRYATPTAEQNGKRLVLASPLPALLVPLRYRRTPNLPPTSAVPGGRRGATRVGAGAHTQRITHRGPPPPSGPHHPTHKPCAPLSRRHLAISEPR